MDKALSNLGLVSGKGGKKIFEGVCQTTL